MFNVCICVGTIRGNNVGQTVAAAVVMMILPMMETQEMLYI